jgi:CheY-like chemotaxis protein/HAMP domain-containing protein
VSRNPSSSLRVLIVGVVVAAMVYGAALTLALTGHLGSATGIVVLIVGAVLLPVALFIVRRRIWTPLTEIEQAIRRVAEGELSTQVPVARDDELGTIGTHFNHMTRVLRDRAEEQGRFAAAGELLGGVAHEVNNPLMAIASHAELRLADGNLPAEQRNEMQSIDSFVDDTGSRVCVTVTDNGPGVAPEISQRLFRPFASTKGIRGTGLGLYISRQLVREAEGELDLVTLSGPGARFLVWLPTAVQAVSTAPAAVPQAPPVAPAVPPKSLAGIRVLLVDDEELIRRPMSRFLSKRGAEIREAGDGQAALDRLQEGFDPHVILADLRMPRMDGAELYARLQQEHPALAERLIFLSGDITHLASRGLAEVPRDRVLVKPVELVELEQRIAAFVREKAA